MRGGEGRGGEEREGKGRGGERVLGAVTNKKKIVVARLANRGGENFGSGH